MTETIKVIITGATGMVGEGVMQECLQSPLVSEVLVITRKPTGEHHPKLKEIIHSDFFDLSPIESQLAGYDACYFCLGVTSLGKNEAEYYKLTHTLTLHCAELLAQRNTNMVFNYVSGIGTDSTEKGSTMWARVKGKTENDLFKLPFKAAYAFRPGFMKPSKSAKRVLAMYKYIGWFYSIGEKLFPNAFCTLAEVGQAMIKITFNGYNKNTIQPNDIRIIAKQTV